MISCIHATRGRPMDALYSYKLWMERANDPKQVEWVFSTDEDDQAMRGFQFPNGIIHVTGIPRGSVAAYNRGLYSSSGDVIAQVMDDLEPPMGWDKSIGWLGTCTTPKLLHVHDLKNDENRKPWLHTVLIGNRHFFKSVGYMYHPSYVHCYGDDDQSIVAHLYGWSIDSELVFKHNWLGVDHDDTAKQAYSNEYWRIGIQALVDRIGQGFPLCPQLWGHQLQREQ